MKYLFWIYVGLFLDFSIPCIGQVSRTDSLNHVYKERSRWEKDLKNITEAAYLYHNHPRALKGGEGSYIGFTLPKNCDSTEFGTYGIYELLSNKIVIQANLHFNKMPLLCIIDSGGNCTRRIPVNEYEIDRIGELAYQYRIRPASDGGGGGSYEGFRIPDHTELTAYGRYTIRNVKPEEITFQAYRSIDGQCDAVAVFDANGRKRMPFDYQIDLKNIESLAYQYRTRPISQGGGGGSYIGFKMPRNLDSTSNGIYWINVYPHELVINMRLPGSQHNILRAIDSTGKEKFPVYHEHGNGDDYLKNNPAMAADIKVISKQAVDYWMRSRPAAGMRGSFEGFTIPISIALTKNGTYSIAELRKDKIYVQAVSSIGSGKKYFMIDYIGNQIIMQYGQYDPPVSQLKNNTAADPLTMYKNADWKLNEVYQQLLAMKKTNKVFIKNLKNAERLWIKYRDAQLTEKYPQVKPASDKSMFTKPQLTYLTILTEDRIKELQDMFDRP